MRQFQYKERWVILTHENNSIHPTKWECFSLNLMSRQSWVMSNEYWVYSPMRTNQFLMSQEWLRFEIWDWDNDLRISNGRRETGPVPTDLGFLLSHLSYQSHGHILYNRPFCDHTCHTFERICFWSFLTFLS